jgi:subtilisin family serine protease
MDRIEEEHAWFRSDLEKIEALKGGLSSTDSGSQATVIRYEYKTALNGVSIKTKQEIIDEIRNLPYVKRVDESRRVYALVDEAATVIGADQVWANHGATGKGIVIGIIDSGIDYMHPDLGGGIGKGLKVIGGYDFINDDSDPMDDNGHGTHVAGIAAANGIIKGIAPEAKLRAYKVLGMNGQGHVTRINCCN